MSLKWLLLLGVAIAVVSTAKIAEGKGGKKAVPTPPAGMLYIPGGTFVMGSLEGDADEKPLTRVTLSPYFMDRTEVSVEQYKPCVDARKCAVHPINCVEWFQSLKFCEFKGARLPTEAEWEFAARGTDGRKFPWGNQPPDPSRARFSAVGTAPVDTYGAGASPFGILNMAGNVWEWASDWRGPYPGGAVTDPSGPATGTSRITRGGGWNHPADWLRATNRDSDGSDTRSARVGFRCVKSAGR
jgi:formylglycine-generating enzyme required for sulfatase activity